MWPDLSLSGRSPPAKSQLNLISALQWGTAGACERDEKLVGSLETRLAEARSRAISCGGSRQFGATSAR
jgi:hypothetical protein